MSRPNLFCPVMVAALLFAGGEPLFAQSTTVIAPPPMTDARVLPGEIIGNEQIQRAFISFGTNEFMFIVPADTLAQFSPQCPASLSGRKINLLITFHLLSALPPQTILKEELKKSVDGRFSSPPNLEEFTMPIAGHEGAGIQFRHTSRFVRVLWVPCQAGLLEFVVDTDAKNKKSALEALDVIITTFSSNENGPIKIIPRLSKS